MSDRTQATLLRDILFHPYNNHNKGPIFRLKMWALPKQWGLYHKDPIAYELWESKDGELTLLFEGDEFGLSAAHASYSNKTVLALIRFLCIKPGDTGREYFKNHTERQLQFCREHGDALDAEARARLRKE